MEIVPYEKKPGDTKDHPLSQWFKNLSEADELLKLAVSRQQDIQCSTLRSKTARATRPPHLVMVADSLPIGTGRYHLQLSSAWDRCSLGAAHWEELFKRGHWSKRVILQKLI